MTLISIFLQIAIGWIYGHAIEYVLHRWVLHHFGRDRSNALSFHFHEHHANVRRYAMHDPIYKSLKWDAHGKEIVSLLGLLFLHFPIALSWPWAYGMLVVATLSYYIVHKRSHTHPEWGRYDLTWHYDHHMGPKQNANYGVRSDRIDILVGTKERYYGTKKERVEWARRVIRYRNRVKKS